MEVDGNKTCSFAAWHLRSLFDYKGERGKNITVQCRLCKPREKFLSTSKSSTSNLKKHLVRKHSSGSGQFLEAGPSGSGSRPVEAGWQNGSSLEWLGEPVAEISCEVDEERPVKQAKSSSYMMKPSQRKLNALVFGFIIDTLQPFSVLETPSFLRLLDGLQTSRGLLTPRALQGKVCWAMHCMTEAIRSQLKEAHSVCTTADLWRAGGRGYMAVTCHWLQEASLERKSAALACPVLQAPPTCHALVSKLREVHAQFDLTDKVGYVVTDSGTQFFPVFGDFGFYGDGEGFDGQLEVKGLAVGDGGVAFEDVSDLLQSDVKELQFLLPAHRRCPAHELSRLVQEEVLRVFSSAPCSELYRGAMAKCHALWRDSHQSGSAPPCLEDLGSLPLRVPRASLWSTEYHAVRKLLSLDGQVLGAGPGQGAGPVLEAGPTLWAEPLSPQERLFLQEYAKVLQPLAYAFDFLQSGKKCMLGYLLPTLRTLRAKLSESRPLVRFCAPLIDTLLTGIDSRFSQVLASRDAKMAAVTVPKLKLWWLALEEREEARAMLLQDAAAEEQQQESRSSDSTSDSDSEAQFFGFVREECEVRSTAEVEVLNYLQDSDKALSSLNKYPTIRRLFLKYNTPLPAGGASVQRLFSHNGHVLTLQHSAITEEYFESVLLLRYNQELCPLTNEGWHWS
ncbi:hypothetical protein GJAV_G00141380 [Gymnothorax javanicus]|nr:hypothetical protein GJAV_G00141380 [Gymnothorax javanicus]